MHGVFHYLPEWRSNGNAPSSQHRKNAKKRRRCVCARLATVNLLERQTPRSELIIYIVRGRDARALRALLFRGKVILRIIFFFCFRPALLPFLPRACNHNFQDTQNAMPETARGTLMRTYSEVRCIRSGQRCANALGEWEKDDKAHILRHNLSYDSDDGPFPRYFGVTNWIPQYDLERDVAVTSEGDQRLSTEVGVVPQYIIVHTTQV